MVASKVAHTLLWTEAIEGLRVPVRTPFTASKKWAEGVVLPEGREPPADLYEVPTLWILGIEEVGLELSRSKGVSIGGVGLRRFRSSAIKTPYVF